MAKVITIKPKTLYCKHVNIEIDMDMRSMQCASCLANVDPFDWIVTVGLEENILDQRLRALKAEIENLKKSKYTQK